MHIVDASWGADYPRREMESSIVFPSDTDENCTICMRDGLE